ncbi:MAG: hypothetical protein VX549_13805 [Pseudomonadota bacterium]|nr:hypothetical protein [Pseudomonadota bacterium]
MAAGLPSTVLTVADVRRAELESLFSPHGLTLIEVPVDEPIPGSYWGDEEAGLIEDRLYLRADTPIHSVLHEGGHWLCAQARGRGNLHTDAASDDAEENAVCYLQILLADRITGFGRQRAWADMDAWGYSFRLGSAQAWFERDADDALAWLQTHAAHLLDGTITPT